MKSWWDDRSSNEHNIKPGHGRVKFTEERWTRVKIVKTKNAYVKQRIWGRERTLPYTNEKMRLKLRMEASQITHDAIVHFKLTKATKLVSRNRMTQLSNLYILADATGNLGRGRVEAIRATTNRRNTRNTIHGNAAQSIGDAAPPQPWQTRRLCDVTPGAAHTHTWAMGCPGAVSQWMSNAAFTLLTLSLRGLTALEWVKILDDSCSKKFNKIRMTNVESLVALESWIAQRCKSEDTG